MLMVTRKGHYLAVKTTRDNEYRLILKWCLMGKKSDMLSLNPHLAVADRERGRPGPQMTKSIRRLVRPGTPAFPLLLLLIVTAVFAQTPPSESTLIKTARGVLVIHNQPGLNFTLELSGKEVQPFDSPDYVFVRIDGRVTQIHTVSVATFAPEVKDRKLNDWLLLERYRDWESDYIGNTLGVKPKIASEIMTLPKNKPALYWSYLLPAQLKQPIKSQTYLTVMSGGHVVMINCAVEGNDNESQAQKFMMDVMGTLKTSDKPFDVKAIQEAIRKGLM